MPQAPQALPAHRDGVLPFLRNYGLPVQRRNVRAADSQGPYASPQHVHAAGADSLPSASADSGEPGASLFDKGTQAAAFKPLLKEQDTLFLEHYGREAFDDMVRCEGKSCFASLMTNQAHITRQLRAAVIDWLFEVGTKMNIEDRGVLFQAILLMDRFYDCQSRSLPTRDLQLTAVTALFIASKNLEVDPLHLDSCVKDLCFRKYSRADFLEKESAIRLATNYENEAPLIVDFVMLYLRLLRKELQTSLDCLPGTSSFLFEVQTTAYDLTKSFVIDASVLHYRPSVVGAAAIFLGFQLHFDWLLQKKPQDPPKVELETPEGKELVGQIALCYRKWLYIVEHYLELDDAPTIVSLSECLFERQVSLYEESRDWFPNIYKDRCAETFVRAPKRPSRSTYHSRTQESPQEVGKARQLPLYSTGRQQTNFTIKGRQQPTVTRLSSEIGLEVGGGSTRPDDAHDMLTSKSVSPYDIVLNPTQLKRPRAEKSHPSIYITPQGNYCTAKG